MHRHGSLLLGTCLSLAMCFATAGCRTTPPTPAGPSLPPPTPLADGTLSYQVGPEHPLVQQANAIRASATAQANTAHASARTARPPASAVKK